MGGGGEGTEEIGTEEWGTRVPLKLFFHPFGRAAPIIEIRPHRASKWDLPWNRNGDVIAKLGSFFDLSIFYNYVPSLSLSEQP